jgi:AcrR family transcriptional regulator
VGPEAIEVEGPASVSAEARPLRADARRNRERILAAAREVFATGGPEAQIDDVAKVAGVGVGTVYRHFATKEALAGELITQKFTERTERAERWLAADVPAWDAFAGFIAECVEESARDAAQQKMMWSQSPDAMAYAEAARVALHETVGRLIEAAQASGDLRPDFTPAHMPALMCGLGSSMTVGGAGVAADGWRMVLDVVLDGLRVKR